MKAIISVALTLCVVAVAAPPPAASAGSPVVKDSAAAGRGVLVDSRDGKSYRTIRIGNQVWMAENLNHATGNSWCYDNDTGNCTKWGRLYDWQTARSACPSGWHLPSDERWKALDSLSTGGELSVSDSLGFDALPGGGRSPEGKFYDAGRNGFMWSASVLGGGFAWYRGISWLDDAMGRNACGKACGFSVRCLKDAP